MNIALGNKKPEPLLEVEKIIWQSVLVLSEGLCIPEDVVEQLLLQIPWETLQAPFLNSSQRSWFDIRAPPLPSISTAPRVDSLLTPTTLLLPTPPSSRALDLLDHMDTTFDHGAQVSVHDPDAMDTQPDGNALHSTIHKDIPGDRPTEPEQQSSEDRAAETQYRSTSVDREPEFPNVGEDGGPDAAGNSDMAGDTDAAGDIDVVGDGDTEDSNVVRDSDAAGDTNAAGKGHATGDSDATEDGDATDATDATDVTEDDDMDDGDAEDGDVEDGDAEDLVSPEMSSEAIATRQSARLNRRVLLSLDTRRSHPGRKGKLMKLKPMSPQKVLPPASELRKLARALKRKERPEVEELLSAGSSAARPIDVDALNALLEKFPVKREPQVKNCEITHQKPADFFLVFETGDQTVQS